MTPLILGVALLLAALLAVVFFVVAPPAPRVAKSRRLPVGVEQVSALTRVTDRTVAAVESATQSRRALFPEEKLRLAGIAMQPSAFLLVVFGATVVLALLAILLGFGTWWTVLWLLLLTPLALVGAQMLLAALTARRRARFAEQLDDTLQLISGNLRAGHGTVQSLDAVAHDVGDPTADELARVVNQTRIGRDLNAALDETAVRMRSDDFTWTAQAIAINRETGGNLSEVLDQVAKTIRERNQIRRQIRALSAEGRLSAIVLIVLPFAVFGAILLTQPQYLAVFFTSIWALLALVVAVVLLIIGIVWMLAVVRIRF